jgi:hypothetical protein
VLSETVLTRLSTVAKRFEEKPADKVEIEQFEQRLHYSLEHQRFLALVVAPGACGLRRARPGRAVFHRGP